MGTHLFWALAPAEMFRRWIHGNRRRGEFKFHRQSHQSALYWVLVDIQPKGLKLCRALNAHFVVSADQTSPGKINSRLARKENPPLMNCMHFSSECSADGVIRKWTWSGITTNSCTSMRLLSRLSFRTETKSVPIR